ncbi:MAG: phage tail tape measure C-terminal domain-containing protein, partial [Cypionkella sp.]|nr:phage tail tape measure C-terminal domain-containing protein [Cypionkella sp.]
PSTLAVGAVILLTTVLVQLGTSMFGASEPTKTFAEALGDSTTAISNLSSATDTLASARLGSLASGYGVVNEALQTHLEKLQQVATLEAMTANRNNVQAAESGLTGSWLNSDLDDIQNKLGMTIGSARQFVFLLDQVKASDSFAEQAKSISNARSFMESLGITLTNSDGAARDMLMSLIKAEDAGLKLKAAADGSGSAIATATSQTSAWASAMSSVRSEISAIMAGLSALSGGAINFAAGRAELLALNAGKSIEAAAQDRQRAELDMKLGQEATAAASRGKGAVWINAGLATLQRSQFEAQLEQTTALNTAREAARKRDTASAGGGAGKGGFKALDDTKVTADILKRAQALNVENHALQAVINSTYKSEEAAKLFGEAMVAGNGAVDSTTRAMLAQIDAAALLNEQLTRAAKDPVREFLASVPLWEEASRSIQGSIVNNMSDTLADFFKTGKLNLASFASSVAGTMADFLAKQTTGMILGKFGITGAITGNETARGGQQAAGMIGNSMIHAGQVVSNLLHGSLVSGARNVGTTVTTTMSTSGQAAGNSLQRGVETGSQRGARTLGDVLMQALSGGGGGGGFLEVIGGVLAGAFSEGGYSSSPISSTMLSPAAFRNAPHFAEGTANTSGIPAVLHDNEAVIPLSRGRKIGVDLKGGGGGGNTTTTFGDINTTVTIDGAGG